MCLSLLSFVLKGTYRLKLCHFKKLNLEPQFCKFGRQHLAVMTSAGSNSMFQGVADRFDGVTVDTKFETCTNEEFVDKLAESLKNWRESKRRGVWFKVNLEHADWVPVLAKNGFNFHHANQNFVTMYKWLPTNEISNIPPYAHTMIGVGGVVVNDKNQVLVVKEKYYVLPHWKLPGGYVEPGENLVDAAIREVFEETNIQTEFVSLLSLRQAHHAMYGCSDLYVVVALRPLSDAIEKCDREIDESKWMDIDEYLNHPQIHELNRIFVQSYLDFKNENLKLDCKHGIHQALKKPYTFYHIVKNKIYCCCFYYPLIYAGLKLTAERHHRM